MSTLQTKCFSFKGMWNLSLLSERPYQLPSGFALETSREEVPIQSMSIQQFRVFRDFLRISLENGLGSLIKAFLKDKLRVSPDPVYGQSAIISPPPRKKKKKVDLTVFRKKKCLESIFFHSLTKFPKDLRKSLVIVQSCFKFTI